MKTKREKSRSRNESSRKDQTVAVDSSIISEKMSREPMMRFRCNMEDVLLTNTSGPTKECHRNISTLPKGST